jgi:hypothetical protein
MTRQDCATCHRNFPMNDTIRLDTRVLCVPCAESELKALGAPAAPGTVRRQSDPTVCGGCGSDFGGSVLATLQSGVPVCEPCRDKFLNRPYPDWIRLSFAGLVAVALLSVAINWRFTAGYIEMQKAIRSMQANKFGSAAAFMTKASQYVSEAGELKDIASFYRGLDLLYRDKGIEAQPLLRAFATKYPGPNTNQLALTADIAAAFDLRDYDTFLAKSKEYLALQPTDPIATEGLASACAAKYASTNDPSFKTLALETMAKAKSLAGANAASLEGYDDRILFRLESREIIGPTEFQKRFPKGWKGGTR